MDPPVTAHVQEAAAPLAAGLAVFIVVGGAVGVLGFGHELDAVPLALGPGKRDF